VSRLRLSNLEAIQTRHLEYAGIRVFVETGTFYAKTALLARTLFPIVHTVELSEHLYNRAVQLYGGRPGLFFHLGDSRSVLPELAAALREPAWFYLDAHWFKPNPPIGPVGGAADDAAGFPLWDELRALAARPFPDIVVVDDVHDFGTPKPRPEWADVTLERIAALFPACREAVILADQAVVYR